MIDARMGQGEWEPLACQIGRINIDQTHMRLSASFPPDAHFYLMIGRAEVSNKHHGKAHDPQMTCDEHFLVASLAIFLFQTEKGGS